MELIPYSIAKKKPNLALTEPEETERSYQDHFLLILCKNLATPAMMGYDTRMKDEKGISAMFPLSLQGVEKKPLIDRDPRSSRILDLQHHERTDGQDCYGGLCQRVRS